MEAEPGRRFLKQPAEKLKAVFVAQSKLYSLSRCSETASSTSTVWASKSLRISTNSLLQAAGDGAVEAARQADSPSKTSGETMGVIAAACAEDRES